MARVGGAKRRTGAGRACPRARLLAPASRRDRPARPAHAGETRRRSQRTCPVLFRFLAKRQAPFSAPRVHDLIYAPTTFPTKSNCHFPICQVRKQLREVDFSSKVSELVGSNPGNPRTPTRNLSFSLLSRGAFSPQNRPKLAPSKRPLGLADLHDLAALLRSRARGAGRRSGAAPGVFKPGLEPAGPDAPVPPCSRLPSPSRSLPRALPPSAPRLLRAQAPAGGRGEPDAGGARLWGVDPRPWPPRIAQPAPPGLPPSGCPHRVRRGSRSPDADPERPADGRAGGCGRPAGSSQHGFGFRRAERGRARDRRRYRGDAAAQPGGPGPGGGEAGAGNREYVTELPDGRPISSRPGLGIAPRYEFAVRLSPSLHLGAREEEEVLLRVALRAAASRCGLGSPGLRGGGERFGKSASRSLLQRGSQHICPLKELSERPPRPRTRGARDAAEQVTRSEGATGHSGKERTRGWTGRSQTTASGCSSRACTSGAEGLPIAVPHRQRGFRRRGSGNTAAGARGSRASPLRGAAGFSQSIVIEAMGGCLLWKK